MHFTKKMKKAIKKYWQWGFLILIMYIAFAVRTTYIPTTVADYDPWWYYRHTVEIIKFGRPPKWDILSFYPPGRPEVPALGVEYALIFFWKLARIFVHDISFLKVFIMTPPVLSALAVIPAYYVGKLLTNKLGGLVAAISAVLPPAFIGYSVAGYMDSKPFVVLYTFLTVYTMILAIKKRKWPYYILATAMNLLFIYTWYNGGWFVLIFFTAFIPALIIFRILEQIIHCRCLKINLHPIIEESKKILLPIIIIDIAVNAITIPLLHQNILGATLVALKFQNPKTWLLVNISVAELQPINIFTWKGFSTIAWGNVGLLPTVFTIFGLPLLVVYKLIKKEKINPIEIFLFLWAGLTFYAILHGVRFALLFSSAAAISAGYVVGNIYEYLKNTKPIIVSSFLGLIILLSFILVSKAYQYGLQAAKGYQVDKNWIDALDWLKEHGNSTTLVATWWDPGHIIAGYTGLKVHADGAHCTPQECIPYNHNIRIQDMGRVFSTSDEEEAVKILHKYMYLTPQQCAEVKARYGDIIYDNVLHQDPCTNSTTMYFIASNDLIGKYYWLSYFGTGQGRQYWILPYSGRDSSGNLVYGNGLLKIVKKGEKLVPIFNLPQQGIVNSVVQHLVLVYNGVPYELNYTNVTNSVKGTVLLTGENAIYMDPQTSNCILTRLYFYNGYGLKHFKLVYANPEVKIFKVIF